MDLSGCHDNQNVSESIRVDKLKGYCNIGYQQVIVILYYKTSKPFIKFSCNGKWKTVSNHLKPQQRLEGTRMLARVVILREQRTCPVCIYDELGQVEE